MLGSRRCPRPECGRPLKDRQKACSPGCRAWLWRQGRQVRDREILALVDRVEVTQQRAAEALQDLRRRLEDGA